MKHEYHFVKLDLSEDAQQGFIFDVVRLENDLVFIDKIYTITNFQNKEIKTRIHLTDLMKILHENVGGNIPEQTVTNLNKTIDEDEESDEASELIKACELIADGYTDVYQNEKLKEINEIVENMRKK
jgi:Ca2+-binding EF-hand superfamily protein